MSGKAPPRGPRALLGSLPAGTSSPASSTPSSSTPASPAKKIPTGPRSLTQQTGQFKSVKPKPTVNGHINVPGPSTVPAKSLPTGPSALLGRLSDKGKQAERSPTVSKPQVNGAVDMNASRPSNVASTSDKLPASISPIKFAFSARKTSGGIAPPQPSSEPPPPPPPLHPPPPPPPPSSAPPPIPPPAPSLAPPQPTEPISRAPTPPRPPSIASIPPPPPLAPPPLPPSVTPAVPTKPNFAPPQPQPPPSPLPPVTPPQPQTYSLPPLPSWPPERSAFPSGHNFKVLYDPVLDKDRDRDGRLKSLLDRVRAAPSSGITEPRIKGKGKGKEILYRYDGEIVEGEPEILIRDPRKVPNFRAPKSQKPGRSEFHEVNYEYDTNSTGPPPPTSVLITNISPLTPNHQIRRHFGMHGHVQSFEPQIDKENGGALGIIFIKFNTHEEAKKCVEKENGKRLGVGSGMGLGIGAGDGEEVSVVFDGEGLKLRAVMKELDDGRKRVREEKKRKEREAKIKEANAAAGTPPNVVPGQTPQQGNWWPSGPHPHGAPRPPGPPFLNGRPVNLPPHPGTHFNANMPNGIPAPPPGVQPGRVRRPPPALMQARFSNAPRMSNAFHTSRHPLPPHPHAQSLSSSSTPIRTHPVPNHLSRLNSHAQPSPLNAPSRSPSPISRRPGQLSQSAKQNAHDAVNEALTKNGFEYAKIDGTAVAGSVTEDDVKTFFQGFMIDTVLQDYLGWYITFQTQDTARRAAMVLNSGARTLAHHSVTISVHPAPSKKSLSTAAAGKVRWDDDEMVEQAQQMIVKELRGLLEKDVMERVIGTHLKMMVAQEKVKKTAPKTKASGQDDSGEQRAEKRGLKGLSFKKPNKRLREELQAVIVEADAGAEALGLEEEAAAEEIEVVERPKKRRRKDVPKQTKSVIDEDDIESEDEDTLVPESVETARKRASSEDREEDEPVKKKPKTVPIDDEAMELVKVTPKKKKQAKKASRPAKTKDIVDAVIHPGVDFDLPELAQVHVTGFESSLSRSPTPIPVLKAPRLPSPPPDPLEIGLCQDDEDIFFSQLALSATTNTEPPLPVLSIDADTLPPFRTHVTGSARTEGFYKISHAEKSAYVAQYALRATATEQIAPVEAQPQHVTSSRSNRANARRRAQGLEEINQVQRAVALSKGETAAEMTIKFNQLQTRKKHLRFARSPIHDWGLYAMERISRGEMVIEYVGEVIRAQVADKREKAYERQGIGSSYLFRIDEDLVVDATKKGNLGRLINHACDPNCTAKIITINSEKKIVIYAKRDIELGDEITYDYHFPIEQDKIPCLCGSVKCRGYLN